MFLKKGVAFLRKVELFVRCLGLMNTCEGFPSEDTRRDSFSLSVSEDRSVVDEMREVFVWGKEAKITQHSTKQNHIQSLRKTGYIILNDVN